MGDFLVQKDRTLDYYIVQDVFSMYKYAHNVQYVDKTEIDEICKEGYIPIGNIEFVSKYMYNTEGIAYEQPIEIPKYLQTEEFLKRTYRFVNWKTIPRKGKFFLKDVSRLKVFGDIVAADYMDIDMLFEYKPQNKYDATLVLNKEHTYLISSLLNIKAEYRVYVIGGDVVSIAYYKGDPMLLPDISIIRKANTLICENEEYLRNYTIDVAVGAFGTALLEVHNFTSVGLYTNIWSDNLLYGYIGGIEYLKKDNGVKFL